MILDMIPTARGARYKLLAAACFALLLAVPTLAFAQEEGVEGEEEDTAYEYDYEADTDASAMTDFDEELSPHGMWVDDETYGRVWVPSSEEVGGDFQPYRTA